MRRGVNVFHSSKYLCIRSVCGESKLIRAIDVMCHQFGGTELARNHQQGAT
jgi:hypothetical protein